MPAKACLLVCVAVLAAHSQTAKDPAFEVVSIKAIGPAISYGPGGSFVLGLRYTGTRITGNSQIPALIEDAFSLKPFQIELPDRGNLSLECYAIDAVMAEGTTRDTANLMFRTMLVERFGLKFHRETKDIPVYVLTEGKARMKLQPVTVEEAKGRVLNLPSGARKGVQSASGAGWYAAAYTTVEAFAAQMSNMLDRPLIDQSGIQGTYAVDLRWDRTNPMDLIAVIEGQLGFKLERRKLPYEMFVVDHVDSVPVAN
jgi:uncharacterized protein (TIGR03435 family)